MEGEEVKECETERDTLYLFQELMQSNSWGIGKRHFLVKQSRRGTTSKEMGIRKLTGRLRPLRNPLG